MRAHQIVVIGASAGGLQALSTIVSALPANLPASVLIVVHSSSNGPGVLPDILERISSLRVAFATDDEALVRGRIYIARPDFHLIVNRNTVSLVHGPRENGFRPAIDPTFRTAAREHGPRVIGVVLSGALSDGTYGLSMIKHHGGLAVAQDPTDAIIPSMPQSAIRHVDVDHVMAASDIGPLLDRLTRRSRWNTARATVPHVDKLEPQRRTDGTEVVDMTKLYGPPSALTCPDCGGALWEVRQDRVVRYHCHTGHQYAPENLVAGQSDAVDGALWTAVRILEEHVELKTRMSRRAADGGLLAVSEGFAEGARDAQRQAERIRAILFNGRNGKGGDVTDVKRARGRSRAAGAAKGASNAARAARKPHAGRTRKKHSR